MVFIQLKDSNYFIFFMSTKIILSIIAVVVIGIGLWFGLKNKDTRNTDMMQNEETENMMAEGTAESDMNNDMVDDASGTMQEEGMTKVGSYESYAPEKLARAVTGDVVLFFRASWCPSCKAVDADIRSHLKDIPETLTILDVNYDTATDLKQKYGVTYQHTFVQVDAEGNMITKWSGSPTLADLVSHVK